MKKTVILEDLDCAHCAGKIEEAVNELKDDENRLLFFCRNMFFPVLVSYQWIITRKQLT